MSWPPLSLEMDTKAQARSWVMHFLTKGRRLCDDDMVTGAQGCGPVVPF